MPFPLKLHMKHHVANTDIDSQLSVQRTRAHLRWPFNKGPHTNDMRQSVLVSRPAQRHRQYDVRTPSCSCFTGHYLFREYLPHVTECNRQNTSSSKEITANGRKEKGFTQIK